MEVPLFLQIPNFLSNTVQNKQRVAFVLKTSSIRSVVLTEHQFVKEEHRAIRLSRYAYTLHTRRAVIIVTMV